MNTFKIEMIVTDEQTDKALQYDPEELLEEIRNYFTKGLFLKVDDLAVTLHQR